MVGILDRFDLGLEPMVQETRQHAGERLETGPIALRQLLGAHRDDVAAPERQEVLTAHRLAPSWPSPSPP
jgi:hypothetical protein